MTHSNTISKYKMLNSINVITKILLFLLLLIPLSYEDNLIHVERSGVKPLGTDVTSLTFFATVENKGSHALAVGLEMEQCCQEVTANDTDCDSMKLHNGLRVELSPKGVKNLTLYYTNHYLEGREGDCWVKVKWRQGSKGSSTERFKIHFDTRLSLPTFLQKVLSLVPGSTYRVCESVDQDPQRECLPVNCLLKYSGFRSHYNKTERKCQRTPRCIDLGTLTPEMEKKPNVIVSPISNKCKNINTAFKFNEKMKQLQDIAEVAPLSYAKYPVNVKCVNGHRNRSEELCICDTGWTSRNFPAKTFNPEHETYHMCDIPSYLHPTTRLGSTSLMVLIGLVILLVLVLCIYLPFVCRRYVNRMKIESMTSELATSSSSSSSSKISIVSEVKSHRSVVLPPLRSIPTKSKMLEFSDLLRDEKTTKPASSLPRLEYTSQKPILRYPQNFQLKPPLWSRPPQLLTPSTSPSTSSSTQSELPVSSFSIPDTSEVAPYFDPESVLIPLTSSCSLESFPRRVMSSASCSCTCCNNNNDSLQPLVTVRVHQSDANANRVVTLRRFGPDEAPIQSENVQCEGTPQICIVEMVRSKWKAELEELLEDVCMKDVCLEDVPLEDFCLEDLDPCVNQTPSEMKLSWAEYLVESETSLLEEPRPWMTDVVQSDKLNESISKK